MVAGVRPVIRKATEGSGANGWKAELGGSSGHNDSELSARLRQLMQDKPFFMELDTLRRLAMIRSFSEKMMNLSSSSMLLTTEQIAEGTPQKWRMDGGKSKTGIVHLTPEEQEEAKKRDAAVPESEFYGLHNKFPAPGSLEARRRG